VNSSQDQLVALPNRLTGAVCHRLLVNNLLVILGHGLVINNNTCGSRIMSLRTVRQNLSQIFGKQWIGHGGPGNWSARSPPVNPLDFCLWGCIMTLKYSAPIKDLDVLQLRVENAPQEIKVKPEIFERVRTSV
jgi:hypothetical protein